MHITASPAEFEQDRADRARRRRTRLIAEMAAQPCAQCSHGRFAHNLFHEPGDPEEWSWCTECGGRCEFVPVAATPEPEPYAVAPLGDGWTVVAPDAESIVAPTDWSLVEAVAAAGWLNRGLSAPAEMRFVPVAV